MEVPHSSLADSVFDQEPELLDRIELRAVRGEEEVGDILQNDIPQNQGVMNLGIVEHQNRIL